MSNDHKIVVYLLHFNSPIHHVQHYMGSTTVGRLETRMAEHAAGRGAALTAEAVKRGIGWQIACTWLTDDRTFEQRRKKIRKYSRQCVICQNPGQVHALFTVVPRPVPVEGDGTKMLSWPSDLGRCPR